LAKRLFFLQARAVPCSSARNKEGMA
jgi:hypothetical protein